MEDLSDHYSFFTIGHGEYEDTIEATHIHTETKTHRYYEHGGIYGDVLVGVDGTIIRYHMFCAFVLCDFRNCTNKEIRCSNAACPK